VIVIPANAETQARHSPVIPAKAGIKGPMEPLFIAWIPAFAGMTGEGTALVGLLG
jgi:hypothetical protein